MKPFRTYKQAQEFARSVTGDFSLFLEFYGTDQRYPMTASFERHARGLVAVFWRAHVYLHNAEFISSNSERGKAAA